MTSSRFVLSAVAPPGSRPNNLASSQTLLEKYPKPAARVLHTAVQWRIGASEVERKTEDPDWCVATDCLELFSAY